MIFGVQGYFWYLVVHYIANAQSSCGQSGLKREVMPHTRPHYLFMHVTKHNSE